MSDDIDYDDLDPGIREVVRALRAAGFDTCDSGDGATKRAAGWGEEAADVPHVAIQVDPDRLVLECERLHEWLRGRDLPVGPIDDEDGVYIQGSYDPHDGTAIVMLVGLDDRLLGAS